jgi:hypothetical protein
MGGSGGSSCGSGEGKGNGDSCSGCGGSGGRRHCVCVTAVVLENIQKSRPPKMYQYIFPSYRDDSHKFQQNQLCMDKPN